jgi:N-acetylmuramoyl-L-alanine amidase
MTRNSDAYLTLEERTAIANTKNADLFISIHANDSVNKSTYGIETYFLNLATDNSEITVAARENATSTKNISDLQTILTDIMQNTKIDESSLLASYIQDSSCNYLTPMYTHIKDRGVKKAPFYVLLGARMPAILIEASFISNPRECKRLTRARYQEHLCEGILDGIQKYVEKSRMAS